jgi:hypothetical protein
MRRLTVVLVALLIPTVALAQQMPDPSLIHGRALPGPELRDGTVTVRIVREAIGNDAPGQQVRVTVGGTTRTATTDKEGRAEFNSLPAGEGRAEATVDGETMQSQPFVVPTSGGLKVILVAGLAKAAERKKLEEAAERAAPPTKGVVVLGGDSRIVMEFNNDSLFAYYLLDIVNTARSRVDIGGPLRLELPPEAAGVRLYTGATEGLQVEIDGPHVAVQGPFAPGITHINLQFDLRFANASHTVVQPFPVSWERPIVGIEKVGSLGLASPQFSTVSELPTENGVYLLGQGGALQAGTPLTFTLSNMPVHSRTSLYFGLGLALLIVAIGGWLALTPATTAAVDRKALVSRRDTLLTELAQLEAKRRDGTIPERSERRRQRILGELEHIYAELDATAGPRGGGEGIAA